MRNLLYLVIPVLTVSYAHLISYLFGCDLFCRSTDYAFTVLMSTFSSLMTVTLYGAFLSENPNFLKRDD